MANDATKPGVPLRRLGAAALVLGVVQGLGAIVRDCALTCNVGYRAAPVAFLVVALLSLPIVALQLRMQRRWGPEAWRVRSTFVVAASLLLFRAALYALGSVRGVLGELASKATYLSFYVWVDVAFMVLGAQLFSLLQGDEEQTNRGLTVFAGAVYAGGIAGGLGATALNAWFQDHLHLAFDVARDNLMLPMALVLVLLVPIARAPTSPVAPTDAPRGGEPGALRLALRMLTGDAEARTVSTTFALSAASALALETLFYQILSTHTSGGRGYVQLLGTLAIYMNGASLVLAAGGASQIIRRVGVAAAVLVVPVSLVLGSGYLLVATALTALLVVRVLKDSLSGGLYEPASERLLVRLQGESYGRQRPVFDVASRLGTGAGALLVLALLVVVNAPVRMMIAVVVLLHAAWFASLIPLVRRARRAGVAPTAAPAMAAARDDSPRAG